MKKCSNLDCGRHQESGNFCGACGSKLEAVIEQVDKTSTNQVEEGIEVTESPVTEVEAKEVTVTQTQEVTTNEPPAVTLSNTEIKTAQTQATATSTMNERPAEKQSTEEAKAAVKSYWAYSVELLKNPSKALQHQQDKFTYGLINLGLYALTFALITFAIMRRASKDAMGYSGFGGFADEYGITSEVNSIIFQTSFYTLIGVAFMLAVLMVSLLAVEKVMVKRLTFKDIIAQYGGLIVPFIYLQAAVFLFSFIGTRFVTFSLMFLSIAFVMYILAGLYMYEKVNSYQSSSQKVYTFIGTIIFVTIVYTVVSLVIGASLLESLIDLIDEMVYF